MTYLKIFWLSDCRFSTEQEAKLIYAVRVGTDFVEFRQLQEVGIFSYFVYYLAKSHFNGWGFVGAWMVVLSVSKSLNRVKKSLLVWP